VKASYILYELRVDHFFLTVPLMEVHQESRLKRYTCEHTATSRIARYATSKSYVKAFTSTINHEGFTGTKKIKYARNVNSSNH